MAGQQARSDVTIASVVTRAAQHIDMLGRRKTSQHRMSDCVTSAQH
jgi:hypothetical protein